MIPGSERSAGEGIGYPLQYSSLENSMYCIVYGVAKSRTRLSDFHFSQTLALESLGGPVETQIPGPHQRFEFGMQP